MDPLTAVSLVGTIVQFVDFGAKVISKSAELYRSGSGALDEHVHLDKATYDLSRLNQQLKPSTTNDPDLQLLCKACKETADELLAALLKVKVNAHGGKWTSFRKALRSIWSKEKLQELENRVSRFRDELNLRITVSLREDLAVLKEKHSDQFMKLDEVGKTVADAIIRQTDIFIALHDTQIELHEVTRRVIEDAIQRDSTETRNVVSDAIETFRQSDAMDKIIRVLSAPNPSENYQKAKKTRQSGTGSWFLENERYKMLKNGQIQAIWIHGIPGCGKSILSSTILDDLFGSSQPATRRTIIYFYFDFSNPLKRDPKLMVRSILTQLVRNCSSPDTVEKLFPLSGLGGNEGATEEYLDVLQALVRVFPRVYLIVDALDECEDREQLCEILTNVAQWNISTFHLIVTSRKEHDIERWLKDLVEVPNIISLQSDIVDADIQLYIQGRLSTDKRLQRWSKDHTVRANIENTLIKGANGMFRWAACQLDALTKCYNRAMLQISLSNLPPTLDKTYERILDSIPAQHIPYTIRILRWLAFSKRPLLLGEAAQAVAIDPEREVPFDQDEILEDPLDILEICPSLLSQITLSSRNTDHHLSSSSENSDADSERSSSHNALILAHYSVKEYLTSDRCKTGPVAQFSTTSSACHRFITACCLSYLQLRNDSYVACHEHRGVNLGLYSAEFWFHHARASILDQQTIQQAVTLMSSSNPAYYNWIRLYDPDQPWRDKNDDLNAKLVPSPLYYASLLGLVDIARCVVTASGADINAKGGGYGNALQAASSRGHREIVQLLIDSGANVNIKGGRYSNALQAACRQRERETAQLLINSGADVNATASAYGNSLQMVSARGHREFVQLLIDSGAEVNAQGGRYGNALQAACRWGECEIVRLLINGGADVNAGGGSYGSALLAASSHGHQEIVQLLIDSGADVNKRHRNYCNALLSASANGHNEIAQLLINNGAEVNSQGIVYPYELQAASARMHPKITRQFIDNTAVINSEHSSDSLLP